MRRKSERKAKGSPEKKVEKVKRTPRTRRRKQSTSSENESAEESTSIQVPEIVEAAEVKPPQTPVKADSPDETQEQVWQVKTSEAVDAGEIQKLKICLTRPTPSTPERADRSPRSKRKHSRATSSSDTPSVEGVEDRKKTRHRSKKSSRESKEASEKSVDSQEDKSEELPQQESPVKKHDPVSDETPMSTSSEKESTEKLQESSQVELSQDEQAVSKTEAQAKTSDADTTVSSPKSEALQTSSDVNTSTEQESVKDHGDKQNEEAESRAMSPKIQDLAEDSPAQEQVSKCVKDDSQVTEQKESTAKDNDVDNNETHVVETTEKIEEKIEESNDINNKVVANEAKVSRQLERSDSIKSSQDEAIHNGHTSLVVNRKRRWGTRQNKLATQKSITISTDVLKDIIPDVKPVEFDEVIEEKKHHKRIEPERFERPVLPKIVIDNTENVENHKKEYKENENVKAKDSLGSNRKISIVKENDSILTMPPSPPRHKPSRVLFISNLVRPFTLPQLKNLLQRTGRIVENGFWIDRIKSKCFVIYETEDQAVETRHALHGVTWPVSNPKTLQVDFSTQEALENTKLNEETDGAPVSTLPGTVEDWLREQDQKRERGELEKPWERKGVREWDVGKNDKEKEKDKMRRDERPLEKRRHRTPERSPEPARKFKKKEEEAPAKLLDDLFRKTKTTPCIYWLPLSTETIAIKEEQRRQHMAEHERRMLELRRHRRH